MSYLWMYFWIIIYLGITAFLAYIAYRQTKSNRDYLIAGGNIHPFIMAMAYGATFISTSAIVGFAGAAATLGMGVLWLTFLNIGVGIFIAFIVYGKRTLRLGRNMDVHTLPELLANRFESPFIQRFTGAVIFLCMPLYSAAVIIGAARFMEEVLKMNYITAVIVFTLIVGAYVVTGGLKGVVYTDAFQGTLMFIGMSILLVATYIKLGGVIGANQALTDLAAKIPSTLAAAGHQGWTMMPKLGSPIWLTLVTTIVAGVGIGVLAQPQLVVRFLTVKSGKDLNRAVGVGGVFILFMTGVAFTVGSLTNVFFNNTAGKISLAMVIDPVTKLANSDKIMPMFIFQSMPNWFSYLFMLTLLSAAMSTASGVFHTMGSAISRDLYQSIKGSKNIKNVMVLNRISILIALVISVWLSFTLSGAVVVVGTTIFFGIASATILPAYTAGLFWKRSTREGAIASILVGFISSIFLLTFVHAKEAAALGIAKALIGRATLFGAPWTFIDPISIALPISAITLVVVSLLTRPMAEDHVSRCFTGVSKSPSL